MYRYCVFGSVGGGQMPTMEEVQAGRPTEGVTVFVAQVLWEMCQGKLGPIGKTDELPVPQWPLDRKLVLIFERPTLHVGQTRIFQIVNVRIDDSTKNIATLNVVWLVTGRGTPQNPLWKVGQVRYLPDYEALGTDFPKELTAGISMSYRNGGTLPESWHVEAVYAPDRQSS